LRRLQRKVRIRGDGDGDDDGVVDDDDDDHGGGDRGLRIASYMYV
jgi:hypothetical protein